MRATLNPQYPHGGLTMRPMTMTQTNAWHGDASLKLRFVGAAVEHREADRYIQGHYAVDLGSFHGCSVGCSLATVYGFHSASANCEEYLDTHHFGDHTYLAEALGVPEFVVHLQDKIFEGLPEGDAMAWTERLFTAIPVGADLTGVLPRFLLALQHRNQTALVLKKCPAARGIIQNVAGVLAAWARTGEADQEAARCISEADFPPGEVRGAHSALAAARGALQAAQAESAREVVRCARRVLGRSASVAVETSPLFDGATRHSAKAAFYRGAAAALIELIEGTGHDSA